ncbi:MAG: metal-dependent hydrolase [Thiohalophilus sp.]|uniref:metal-dependent hydrolase n=1 Tax=Thiohalophilus sp. TaxID=3028392 RepID=UPI00287034E4|nr:metal-dependent hydrolase [Thiohalophilus sp.]MDR9437362.1 metal-dependent hydrolase [Thiohalophilus sp.]
MDTLTHGLSSVLLARATASETPDREAIATGRVLSLRSRLTAGFLAGIFPDGDFLVRLIDGPLSYLKYHRGITHSVLMLPLWAGLLSLLFVLLWRGQYHWRAFYAVCAMSLGIHIFGDVITSFGTMILAPFSHAKFSLPSTFIIDFWFSGIIILALLVAWIWRRQGQQVALVGLTTLAMYIGMQHFQAWQARDLGREYVQQQGLEQSEVHALPQPLSPFNWKIVIEQPQQYHVSYVNLHRQQVIPTPEKQAGMFERINAIYRPLNRLNWETLPRYGEGAAHDLARNVWHQAVLKHIRDFMLFPALYRIEQREQGLCAWFQDHRFILGDARNVPFRFGACRNGTNDWQLYRHQGDHIVPLSP